MDYRDEISRARYLIKNTFGGLIFKEDTHQYFLQQPDGSMKEYDCVSNFTHQFEATDFNEVAKKYAEKHGNTAEFWRSEWAKKGESACALGTQVHEFAESLGWLKNCEGEKICESAKSQYNPDTNTLTPLKGLDKLSLKESAVKNFYDNLHPDLHFVMAETQIFTSMGPFAEIYPINYAGTFDLLLYYEHPNDPSKSGYVIGDFKTNSSLEKPFAKRQNQTLKKPFNDLIEEPLSFYTLQLSCYQIPMEAIGLKVIARRLIHLDDKGNYKLIPVPDVTDRIKNVLRGEKTLGEYVDDELKNIMINPF